MPDVPRRVWAPLLVSLLAGAVALLAMHPWPGTDAWGWLVWGRQAPHLDVDTLNGPAWKPGTTLVAAVLSVFGDAAPTLWLIVAAAGAFLGVGVAYGLADRLAGPVAGVVAAAGVVLLPGWLGFVSAGYADPIALTLTLAAAWLHLTGRPRAVVLALLGASLLRPELAVLIAGYAGWRWRPDPAVRVPAGLALVVVVLAWFGVQQLASGDAFDLSATARTQTEAPTGGELLRRATSMLTWPTAVLALVAFAMAARRRPRDVADATVLVLSGVAVGVLVLVAAMGLAGFGGDARFMYPAGGALAVVAGVGAARLAAFARPRPVVLVLLAVLVAGGLAPRALDQRRDLRRVEAATARGRDLAAVLHRAGRERLLGCGRVAALGQDLAQVAYRLDVPLRRVDLLETAPFLHRGIAVLPAAFPSAHELARKIPLRRAVVAQRGPWRLLAVGCPAFSGSGPAPRAARPRGSPRGRG